MDIATACNPVFSRTPRQTWLADPIARGPFEGLQGGVVAALMSAQIEALAVAENLGAVRAFTVHFLKPVPIGELVVACQPLRVGRRVGVVDATLMAGAELCAVARATLIAAMPDARIPCPPPEPRDPTRLPLLRRAAPHGGAWFMDAMEVRAGQDGWTWFRLGRPVCAGQGPMTRVLPAADWAHGVGALLGAPARPAAAIPNPDLTVHLFRPPEGEWVGLDAASAWSGAGVGAGWAAIHDERGLIGRVAMSIAVTLLEG